MSFTNEVKHELCCCEVPESVKEPLRYGLFYGFRGSEPYFFTRDNQIASFVKKQFSKKDIKFETDKVDRTRKNYFISSSGMELRAKYGFFRNGIINGCIGEDDEQIGAFLRGVFITAGNVYVQKAGYHLELAPDDEERCEMLYNMINEHGMKIDLSHRGNDAFLYNKNSENIADFLTFIGATQSSMEIMNIKIMKEFRSNVNRSVNCETANIDRTVRASSKQLEDLQLIEKQLGMDKLGDDLRELALLRLENPTTDFTGTSSK